MKLTFAEDGQCIRVDDTGDYAMPQGADSALPLRFTLDNGEIVQHYQGLNDEQAIAEHARLQEAQLAADAAATARDFCITPNSFQRWLGAERRIAIRQLATTDPVAEDLMASLSFLDEIWSQHPDLIAALSYLERKGGALADLLNDYYASAGRYAL